VVEGADIEIVDQCGSPAPGRNGGSKIAQALLGAAGLAELVEK
jgi:hypothetical protein